MAGATTRTLLAGDRRADPGLAALSERKRHRDCAPAIGNHSPARHQQFRLAVRPPCPPPCTEMDLLDRTTRTVDLGHGRRATYVGDHRWEITLRVRERAERAETMMMSSDVLRQLRPGSVESESAERIIAAFGDS